MQQESISISQDYFCHFLIQLAIIISLCVNHKHTHKLIVYIVNVIFLIFLGFF